MIFLWPRKSDIKAKKTHFSQKYISNKRPFTPEGQEIQPADPAIFSSFLELLKTHHCVLGHAVVGG